MALQKASNGRCYKWKQPRSGKGRWGVYKKVNRNNVGVIMPVHILWGSWHKSNLFLYIIKNKKKEQEKDGAEG